MFNDALLQVASLASFPMVFRRSYLKVIKVRKSEGTMKAEYAYNFRKCADAVYPKLSKSVHAC